MFYSVCSPPLCYIDYSFSAIESREASELSDNVHMSYRIILAENDGFFFTSMSMYLTKEKTSLYSCAMTK